MFKVNSRWNHQDSIKVEWNLGKRCNYDCSYCPSEIHDNTSPHTDINILKSTVDKLCELSKPVRLSFTGGEPCVHPHIEELLSYVKEKGIKWLSVTTNGTRKGSWYRQMPVNQYVISLHFTEGDWRKVLDTVHEIIWDNEETPNIVVNVMAHHKMMSECKEAVEFLETFSVPYVIRRIRWTEGEQDLFDDMKYDQNDLDWILSKTATVKPNTFIHHNDPYNPLTVIHANDVIKLHLNKYKGWKCNIGLESLMINWDGDVHGATCRVGGSLGNIYNNTFVIPTEPVICTRNNCTCAADIPITKINDLVPETQI